MAHQITWKTIGRMLKVRDRLDRQSYHDFHQWTRVSGVRRRRYASSDPVIRRNCDHGNPRIINGRDVWADGRVKARNALSRAIGKAVKRIVTEAPGELSDVAEQRDRLIDACGDWAKFAEYDRMEPTTGGKLRIPMREVGACEAGNVDRSLMLAERTTHRIPYTASGDYCGSLVEKANRTVIAEECNPGPSLIETYGGYGGAELAFAPGAAWKMVARYANDSESDVDAADECVATNLADALESLADIVAGLHDYPLVDDEAHSKAEMEAADEGWGNWAECDFLREAEKAHDVEIEDADSSKAREVFEDARERANVYWYCEGSGEGIYVDVEAVAKVLSLEELVALGAVKLEESEA